MENSVARKGFENLLPQYRIDGFNPNDVLTMIEDVDENGQPAEFLYMEFAAAERWFYTVFPNGRMDYDVIALNDKKIVVKGKIFRDINDAMPAVTSLVSRYYTEDAHGKYFEQNAVTAAYPEYQSWPAKGYQEGSEGPSRRREEKEPSVRTSPGSVVYCP